MKNNDPAVNTIIQLAEKRLAPLLKQEVLF